jgi:hypothetical protein
MLIKVNIKILGSNKVEILIEKFRSIFCKKIYSYWVWIRNTVFIHLMMDLILIFTLKVKHFKMFIKHTLFKEREVMFHVKVWENWIIIMKIKDLTLWLTWVLKVNKKKNMHHLKKSCFVCKENKCNIILSKNNNKYYKPYKTIEIWLLKQENVWKNLKNEKRL